MADSVSNISHSPDISKGPLTGLRVLEAGSLIAGPFAARLMSDFGAEVIKIESPRAPDPLREWGHHQFDGKGLWWPVQARGKRLVTIDLASDQGREMFVDLAAGADVLIENFRPGTMEKWDLDPPRLRERNAGLVVARVSGFGQTGRYRERGGFASVAEAMGGLRYINGYPDQPPPRNGISLGDSLASMFALQGILMALYWRASSGGQGQDIDVSLVESCFALLESAAPEYSKLGTVRQPSGRGLARLVPSNIFRSSDGRWVVIAANTDPLFRRLCAAMGTPDLADDPLYATHHARADHQEGIESVITAWAARRTAREIDVRMAEHGVPCGPIYSIADVFDDPYFRERQALVQAHDPEIGPYTAPGVHPKLSVTPGAVPDPAGWEPGRDNRTVFGALLGLDDDELADLADRGVI